MIFLPKLINDFYATDLLPSLPRITGHISNSTSILLEWIHTDGGNEITNYIIHYLYRVKGCSQPYSSSVNFSSWETNFTHRYYRLSNLRPNALVNIGLVAVNPAGMANTRYTARTLIAGNFEWKYS